MSDGLELLRKAIEKLDEEILHVLSDRMKLSREIGKFKNAEQIPVQYPEIESVVIERYHRIGKENKMSDKFCDALAKIILEESVRVQTTP